MFKNDFIFCEKLDSLSIISEPLALPTADNSHGKIRKDRIKIDSARAVNFMIVT